MYPRAATSATTSQICDTFYEAPIRKSTEIVDAGYPLPPRMSRESQQSQIDKLCPGFDRVSSVFRGFGNDQAGAQSRRKGS